MTNSMSSSTVISFSSCENFLESSVSLYVVIMMVFIFSCLFALVGYLYVITVGHFAEPSIWFHNMWYVLVHLLSMGVYHLLCHPVSGFVGGMGVDTVVDMVVTLSSWSEMVYNVFHASNCTSKALMNPSCSLLGLITSRNIQSKVPLTMYSMGWIFHFGQLQRETKRRL